MILDIVCNKCNEIVGVDFGGALTVSSTEAGEIEFFCDNCGKKNTLNISISAMPVQTNNDE